MPKPTSKLLWTVGNPDFATVTQEPTAAKKLAGWLPNEKPPREYMNWLFFNIDEWINYFEGELDNFTGGFDRFVGSAPGQDATLQDAIDNAVVGDRILVTESDALAAAVDVNKNNLEIYFKPGVTYSDGGANHALTVNADGVRIISGRFAGFADPSDSAIEIASGAENTMILMPKFNGNTLNIEDAGENTRVIGLVDENANDSNTKKTLTIDNNISSPASLSGLLFDNTYTIGVELLYRIHRRTSTTAKAEIGKFFAAYDPETAAWFGSMNGASGDSETILQITPAGQIEYTTSNLSGASYSGQIDIIQVNRMAAN